MAGVAGDKQANRVSEEIVSMIAAKAALKVSGVSKLNEDLTDNLTKKILGKERIAKGIGLFKEPEGIGIDVYLSVEYETKIPDLAWEVQTSVKEAVETVTGLSVQKVNIHVQGVTLSGEMKESEETAAAKQANQEG
ncbi:MAG: Asp23/Gls24 family envelope stress response protein [Firmicutes bacterium]|nr:Asp23/Gls24 family envelope stress response protein [Bacillota bacterium]